MTKKQFKGLKIGNRIVITVGDTYYGKGAEGEVIDFLPGGANVLFDKGLFDKSVDNEWAVPYSDFQKVV